MSRITRTATVAPSGKTSSHKSIFGRRGMSSKRPDGLDHYPANGHVEFVSGSPAFLSRATFMMRPKAGDFFIFPADMYHTVYPFKTDGERRSFSMNIVVSELEQEQDDES